MPATPMSSTPAPLPDDLAALLADPPREVPQQLEVAVHLDGDHIDDLVIRIVTADPLEGEREGPDRFLAVRHLGQDNPQERIAYLSYGDAERLAEHDGWADLLGRVVAAVQAAPGSVGAAHGDDPLVDLPATPAPVTGWTATGWHDPGIGVLVDMAEAEDGGMGFSEEPLWLDPPPRGPQEGCPACAGNPLHPPYEDPAVIGALCTHHFRAHDEWLSAHIPELSEETRTFYELIASLEAPQLSGWAAGLRAVAEGDEEPDAFLRRVRGWGVHPDLLAYMYDDADDHLVGAFHQAVLDLEAGRGVDAVLAALDDQRALLPHTCWLADLDALQALAGDERQAAVLDHLERAHDDVPAAIHAAGEHQERVGDLDRAATLFTRAYVRALAAGDEMTADLGEAGLARLGVDPPRPTGKVGRNDPCPCGSGAKFKRCCGR